MWVSDLGFGERMELRIEGSASIRFTRALIKMSHSPSKYSVSTYYSPSPALGAEHWDCSSEQSKQKGPSTGRGKGYKE